MDELFKIFDAFIQNIGASSPIQLILYKFLATITVALLAWFFILFLISSITEKMKDTRFDKIGLELSVPAKKIGRYIIILVAGTYLIRVFSIRPVENVFYAALLLLIASPIINYTKIILRFLEENIAEKTNTNLDNIIFELLNRFIGIVLGVTAVILALDILGINVMPFIAGAGIVGVAIGFASKDTLSNLIAGILLIIDRPFEVGDRIEVWSTPSGSSSWGDVIDIGLRATKIKTTDNIIVIIPNNEIMMRDIVNYTLHSENIRIRINIGVAYDTDIAKTKEIIKKVAADTDWVMTDPAPKVVVRKFGESSVDLQLRAWISNARKRMDTISTITDKVKEAFDAQGVEIPFPKRDITIIHKEEKKISNSTKK